MPDQNVTTKFVSVQTLESRAKVEASQQALEISQTYEYVSKLPKSRLAKHAAIVNHNSVLAYDVIEFYSKRYLVPTQAPTPYTVADALADIRAAGLPYHMERTITRDAKTRPEVLAAIDAYRDERAALKARQAATLARITAQVVA